LEFVFSSTAIHKPMIAHPDTPDEIVTTLRAAFAALAQDEAYLAEVAERKRIINFTSGDRVQEIVNQTLEVDPVLAGKIRSYVQ
jgi:ABC-type phosphate/phosphonate transport system substrate-binding protein